jgi:hypothetical protein
LTGYSLVDFSTITVEEVARQWRELAADADAYEIELGPLFDFCRANSKERPGHGLMRCLRNDGTSMIDALIETVPAQLRQRTKLLKIWVSPAMWPIDDPATRERLIRTHAAAYVAVIGEAMTSGLREVKIYGRDDMALSVLTAARDVWDGEKLGWEATLQGRWLRLCRK